MSQNFYSQLKIFSDFSELVREAHYQTAPADWWVVIADVEGSTKAIQAGQYKIVNMVGASTIAAVVNAAGTREIPFVFGGDGSTALIPPEALERVHMALNVSREVSLLQHKLKLRIGLVPHQTLIDAGAPVRVARFGLTPGNTIAFFKGQGLSLAEKWVKEGQFLLSLSSSKPDFDPHQGLSCRWAPLENSRGMILSILVKVNEERVANEAEYLKNLLHDIDHIVGFSSPEAHPIKVPKMQSEVPGKAARLETSFGRQGLFKTFMLIWLVKIMDWGFIKLKAFDLKKYKTSLAQNSDYRKFDEMLRMVLDVTPEMRTLIVSLLDQHHARGALWYGVHSSATALMTCFVQETSNNQHVHFIDGGDGGYSMAALGLKQQMKQDLSSEGRIQEAQKLLS